jgi:hypothetical protein
VRRLCHSLQRNSAGVEIGVGALGTDYVACHRNLRLDVFKLLRLKVGAVHKTSDAAAMAKLTLSTTRMKTEFIARQFLRRKSLILLARKASYVPATVMIGSVAFFWLLVLLLWFSISDEFADSLAAIYIAFCLYERKSQLSLYKGSLEEQNSPEIAW